MTYRKLKWIALITMIIDHVGVIFLPTLSLFRLIGRLSFPIYTFLIINSYYKTKNRKLFGLKLLALAIMSQPIYVKLFEQNNPNILFSLLGYYIFIFIYENFTKKDYYLVKLLFSSTLFFSLYYSRLSYGGYGFVMFLILLLYYEKKISKIKTVNLILLLSYFFSSSKLLFLYQFPIPSQVFGIIGVMVVFGYEGERGRVGKYEKILLSLSYPIHLICLLCFKIFK